MNMLEQIYKDNAKKVYRYAYARLNNTAEAEDITSITFIKLLEQQDLTQINNPGFWLVRVARNAIYDKYKVHSPLNLTDEQIDVIEDEQTDYEQMAISEDQKKELNQTLFQLPDLQREIVTLKHWEDMKFSEIAKLVDQKESNVKALYYSALKKLKINLEKEDRKYAAAAYLFSALAAVVTLAEYQPGEIFLSNLLKSLTMSTTTAAVTSAALSTTAKIVLAVGGVSLFTVGTLVGTKINKPQNVVTPVPTVATVEPTIKPTKVVKPTITSTPDPYAGWKSYSFDLYYVNGNTKAATVSGLMPGDAQLNKVHQTEYQIIGDDYVLTISEEGEGEGAGFETNPIFITNHSNFGKLMRVVFKKNYDLSGGYHYLKDNDISYDKSCDIFGTDEEAPCGVNVIGSNFGAINLECKVTNDNDTTTCDKIITKIFFKK